MKKRLLFAISIVALFASAAWSISYAQPVTTPPFSGIGTCPGNPGCPTGAPSPSIVVTGAPNPTSNVTGVTQPTTSVVSPNPTDPCLTEGASLATSKKKSKHWKHKGGLSGLMEALIKFFLELINKLLKLFGGAPIEIPNQGNPMPSVNPENPNVPNQPNEPNPTQPGEQPQQPCDPAPSQAPGGEVTISPAISQSVPSVPAPSVPQAAACTNPVWTSNGTNDMWSNGGYYVHNNAWGDNPGPQTTYACAYNNWYVTSTQTNSAGAVKTYPNVHKDFNNLNGDPWSKYTTITSTFAGKGPGTGIYNVAYDLWLNGVGFGNGTTEVMIWTENVGQRPLGSAKTQMTSGGIIYDVWHYNSGGANVVSFVAKQTMFSGTLNLKEMVDWAIGQGLIPANPSLNQIGYGVEVVSTDGKPATFTFTNFSVTAN